MAYLIDTNVFIHAISTIVLQVAQKCKTQKQPMTITPTIFSELDPGMNRAAEEPSTQELYQSVENLISSWKLIEMKKLEDVQGATEELKKIRNNYYRWMRDSEYLRHLIDTGLLTEDEIRSPIFRNKDLGECELIAIAKNDKSFSIVTNDKGRVYCHPDQNLFEIYKEQISELLSSDEWLEKIGY